MHNTENTDWEMEFSTLAAMSRALPFTVPENYFESAADQLKTTMALHEMATADAQVFSVPTDYFGSLSQRIQLKATLLAEDPQAGMRVPEGYFNALSASILSKIAQEEGILQDNNEQEPVKKVLQLWRSDLMKYAAAACFIMLTATAVYFNQSTSQPFISTEMAATTFSDQELYDIDEATIVEHVGQMESVDASGVSNADAEQYLLDNYTTTELTQEF